MRVSVSMESILAPIGRNVVVRQRNRRPSSKPDEICTVSDGEVRVWTPACTSGVTTQVGDDQRQSLVVSYAAGISAATGSGAKTVVVEPLGATRFARTDGQPARRDPNLFWSHLDSARAARQAVDEIDLLLPKDVDIVFCVPDECVTDWDDVFKDRKE